MNNIHILGIGLIMYLLGCMSGIMFFIIGYTIKNYQLIKKNRLLQLMSIVSKKAQKSVEK